MEVISFGLGFDKHMAFGMGNVAIGLYMDLFLFKFNSKLALFSD